MNPDRKPLKKTGMVFGVFDGLHPGHEHFLKEAEQQAEKLVVVVALPETVQLLKKREPKRSLTERMSAIRAHNDSLHVVEGDSTLGEWLVVKTHAPEIVFLGHDQRALGKELEKLGVEIAHISAHFPEKYKSSLLN